MTEIVSHSNREKEADQVNDNFTSNETNNAASLNSVYESSDIPLNCYDDLTNSCDKVDNSKQDNADNVILFPVKEVNDNVNRSHADSNASAKYNINTCKKIINIGINDDINAEERELNHSESNHHLVKESSTQYSVNTSSKHEHVLSNLWSPAAPLRIAYITWNMAHIIPNENEVAAHCIHPNAHIVIVATQENGPYIGDHSPQRAWLHCVQEKCLHNKYTLVATESMSALHLAIFARSRDVASRIRYVHTSHVSTGRLWSLLGNKGAVAIAFAIGLEQKVHECELQKENEPENCTKIKKEREQSNFHRQELAKCRSELEELQEEEQHRKREELQEQCKNSSKCMHRTALRHVIEKNEIETKKKKKTKKKTVKNTSMKDKVVDDKLVNESCNCALPVFKGHKRESNKLPKKRVNIGNSTAEVNAGDHHCCADVNNSKYKSYTKSGDSCNVVTEEANNFALHSGNPTSVNKVVAKLNENMLPKCSFTGDIFTVLCINAHLAPHQNSVQRRNKNYHKIVHNLRVGTKSRYKAFFKQCTQKGKGNQLITKNNRVNFRANDLSNVRCNTNPLVCESQETHDELYKQKNVNAETISHVNSNNHENGEQKSVETDRPNREVHFPSNNVNDGNNELNNNLHDDGSTDIENKKSKCDKMRCNEDAPTQTNEISNLASWANSEDNSNSNDMISGDVTDQFNVTFFGGDLNYRINGVRTVIEQIVNSPVSMHEALLVNDQLNRERARSTVFRGFNEAIPCFRPTYKYEVNASTRITENIYKESKGKPRLPAFCDRVLFKTHANNLKSVNVHPYLYTDVPNVRTSDHRPVVALFDVSVQKNET